MTILKTPKLDRVRPLFKYIIQGQGSTVKHHPHYSKAIQILRRKFQREYTNYLQTQHWITRRKRYIKTRYILCCSRCGSMQNLQVCHKSYKRLFDEPDSDLRLLCSDCY